MAVQEVRTGRTIVMFRHDINDDTRNRINAFAAAQPLLLGLDQRVQTTDPELLPRFGVAVIAGKHADVCAEFSDALYCVPEGVVAAPVDEDVLEDDESDLYSHLKVTRGAKSAYTGRGVKVALLDTGYYPHPDFYKRVKCARNFVSSPVPDAGFRSGHGGQPPAYTRNSEDVEDRNGHGTHCAGLIVGPRQGRNGGYGLAPEADLYIGRVLNDDGVGLDGDLLEGLNWAVFAVHARVIVVSCGMPAASKSRSQFERLARLVRDRGGVVIAPAGNRLEDSNDKVNYPANCPSVIAAGALNRRVKDADFSCVKGTNDPVEVRAPGAGIRSGWIDGRFRRASGTSMSAAIAGGIAALLAQKSPWCNLFEEVRRAGFGKVIHAP